MTTTVSVVGTGTVGLATVRRLASGDDVHLVSVIGRRPDGQDLVDQALADRAAPARVPYFTSLESALEHTTPDALLIATATKVTDVAPLIIGGLAHGATVLCTSEELAYPDPQSPQTAAILAASREADRGVVAVGVNPGFVFDSVPVWLCSAYGEPRSITVRRIVDASVFGARVRAGLGLDVTAEAFEDGVAAGTIRGHVGFPESARVIARHFGRSITGESETLHPVIRDDQGPGAPGPHGAGTTGGVRQIAQYWIADTTEPWLTFELDLHGDALAAGESSRDEIVIDDGQTTVWTATPSAGAISATSAQLVNLIRPALQMGAGLYTPVDVLGRCRGGVSA